jgi:ABC-type multidrug transport system fused ATPase/permease subunit
MLLQMLNAPTKAPPMMPQTVQRPATGPLVIEKPEKAPFWKTLWPLIAPYRWLIIGALVLNALHGVSLAFQTLMPKYLIDQVLLETDITRTERLHRLVGLIALYIFASLFGRMLVWHIGYRMFTFVREKVLFGLRANFFRHVNHLCLRFHIKHHTGELFSYLFGNPLVQVQAYFQQFTFGAPGAVVQLVTTIIWLGSWDWLLTGVLVGSVLVTVLLMQHTRKRIQKLHSEYQKTESSASGFVSDLLRGSRDVKLYAMEEKVEADFEKSVWEVGQKSYRRDVLGHVEWMKNESVGYISFAVLCAAAAWRYLYDQDHAPVGHRVTIGEIQAYLAAFASIQGSMTTLFQLAQAKGAAQAGIDRIASVLRTASTTPDPIGYSAQIPERGDITLYNVSFGYERETPVLRDVNLTIPYGQRVALVGPSGAGKSTITQLLLRLYDPDQGTVLIGGLNLRHCKGPELRHRFGVVPQDPFIFRTTIRENLCVARSDATDAEIRSACERANAWEFISKMPKGLSSPVGEGGSTLSGGQRQRLAIARALLANPDFFIFDEATSALDSVSEKLVQQAVENAVSGRTALIIAHRLATVKNCDRILVAAEGRIVQDGSYDQLVNQPGIFRELVHGQVLKN